MINPKRKGVEALELFQHLAILGCTHKEETEGIVVEVWLAVIVDRL